MPGFIPKADSKCLAWSANYVHRICANPARYGVSEENAAILTELQADFAEKLYRVKKRDMRNPDLTLAKNRARRAMEQAARRLAA